MKNKQDYLKLYEQYGDIKIKCQGSATLPIDALMDFQKGLKKRSFKNKLKLAKSIFVKGFIAPFFVWENKGDYFLLDGHGRSDVLCELREAGVPIPGFFPVVYIQADDEKDARSKLLAITSQYGEFDETELTEWLKDIDDDFFRFTDDEIKTDKVLELNSEEDNDIPEVDDKNIVSKPGDVWILGNHKLLCGDSQEDDNFKLLLEAKKIDMVFTDPPYGVAIGDKNNFLSAHDKSSGIIKENIKNDNISKEELFELLKKCFINIKNNLSEYNTVFMCAPQGGELGLMMMMMMMMNDAGLPSRHMIIWKKNAPTFSMGRLDYDYKHEPILLTWLGKHKFYGEGDQKTSVWEYNKPLKCDLHPTMKPVELVVNAILNNSKKEDLVFDPFLGSGTTLIACEKTGRNCNGIELDPHYCDVIIERWQQLTEKQAVRIDGTKYNDLKIK